MLTMFTCCGCGEKKRDAKIGQEKIGTVYNRIAQIYDIWGRLTESHARDRAIELAGIENGQAILEVAVGTGIAFREIVARNPEGENTGIDLTPAMLARARKRLSGSEGNYSLREGSAFHLDLPDGSIDILLNNYMFDLIPFKDMDRILIEFRRVLKKGGRLVLVNMAHGEKFGSGIYDRLYDLSPKLMGGCRGVEMAEILREHGFAVKIREYHQQMLFPSEVILAYK